MTNSSGRWYATFRSALGFGLSRRYAAIDGAARGVPRPTLIRPHSCGAVPGLRVSSNEVRLTIKTYTFTAVTAVFIGSSFGGLSMILVWLELSELCESSS